MKFMRYFVVLMVTVLFSLMVSAAASAAIAVNVDAPNGGELVSGIYQVKFTASDTNFNDLNAALYYSLVQGAKENLFASDSNISSSTNCTMPTPSEFACTFDFNSHVASDGQYYIDAEVSDGNSAVMDSSDAAFTIDNTGNAPETMVLSPNGGEVISGTYWILFNFRDLDDDGVLADIYYSETQGAMENLLVSGLDLDTFISFSHICIDFDNDNATTNFCWYRFDTVAEGILYDNNYYIDIVVKDANHTGTDSSDSNFTIDNRGYVPELTITKPQAGDIVSGITNIAFVIRDADNNELHTDIYYSEIQGGKENVIVQNVLADNATPNMTCIDITMPGQGIHRKCIYSWDTSAIMDANLYIDMVARDVLNEVEASSGLFTVNNHGYVPTLSISKPQAGDIVNQTTKIKFHVRDNDDGTLFADIYYSETQGAMENLIAQGVRIWIFTPNMTCIDMNITFGGTNKYCTYRWDTTSASDGEYYIDMVATDSTTDVSASSSQFEVRNAGPYVEDIFPAPGSYTTDPHTQIKFYLKDDYGTIKPLSIKVTVDSRSFSIISPKLSFNTTTGLVVLSKDFDFDEGHVAYVSVYAEDDRGISAVYDWNFTVYRPEGEYGPEKIEDLEAYWDSIAEEVILTWSAPASTFDINYYNLYRSYNPITETNKGTPYATNITNLNYADSGVNYNEKYYYRVTAVDAIGRESLLSNQVSVIAEADLMVDFDHYLVHLEPGQTMGIEVEVENLSDHLICVENTADSHYSYMEAHMSDSDYCLNRGQKIDNTLSITVDSEAELGLYEVEVEFDYLGIIVVYGVLVDVIDEPISEEIDFVIPEDNLEFCRAGYTKRVTFAVTNLTSEEKEVMLYAENQLLLPVFEPAVLTLLAGETRDVDLVFNINETTNLGMHEIEIFIETDTFYMEREIEVEIVECEYRGITVDVSDVCRHVDKEGEVTIPFTVYNHTDEEQTVSVSGTGKLPVYESSYSLTVPANGSADSSLEIKARNTDDAGRYDITLYVYNSEEQVEEEICIIVNANHNIDMYVLNDFMETVVCSANDLAIFELEVENLGEYEEEIVMEIENEHATVGATLSTEEFTLDENATQKVYVTVTPSFDTPLGVKTIYVNAKMLGQGSSDEDVVFDLDNFSEDIETGTIRLTFDGSTYSTSSSKLSYSSSTGKLKFNPSKTYDSDDVVSFTLKFEDEEENEYIFEGELDFGEGTIEDFELTIDVESFDYEIDEDYLWLGFDGEFYDTSDYEISYYSSSEKIIFESEETYSDGEVLDFMLHVEDVPGDHELNLEGSISIEFSIAASDEITKALTFTVAAPDDEFTGSKEDILRITNFPEYMEMKRGESRKVSVTVTNPTNDTIRNLVVKLWGTEGNFYFQQIVIAELEGNSSRTVEETLKVLNSAVPDTYNLTLEIANDDYVTTKTVRVEVYTTEPPDDDGNGQDTDGAGLAGFASLFSGDMVGPGLVILIVVVAILAIAYLASSAPSARRREVWLE